MRGIRLLAATCLVLAPVQTARAGFFNDITRCLGLGWGDGYHARGSCCGWGCGTCGQGHYGGHGAPGYAFGPAAYPVNGHPLSSGPPPAPAPPRAAPAPSPAPRPEPIPNRSLQHEARRQMLAPSAGGWPALRDDRPRRLPRL
jgi:hypothetical protein